MKKAVITGSTGMIGLALISECLANQVQVLAIVRPHSKNINRLPDSPLIEICECNLSEYKAYDFTRYGNDWDVFFNLAWENTDSQKRNSVDAQLPNIGYAIDSMYLAKQLGCKKYVGAGSQAEYGITRSEIQKPDSETHPTSAYGITKLATGNLLSMLARQIGLDFIWARIFSVYGYFDSPNTMISSTIQKILKGERASFTAGVQKWDYLYASDAGRALHLIGEKSFGNKIYCIGSGTCQELKYYIEEMRKAINPNLELRLGELPYQDQNILNICADISDLTRDTGFIPLVSFAEGIRIIINDLKEIS